MIIQSIDLRDADGCCTLKSIWHWTARDPFVVRVEFMNKTEIITWEFDRQIVIEGINGEAGLWDVKMRRIDGTTVRLRLSSPDGAAELDCPRRALRAFVRDIKKAMPAPRLPTDEEMAKRLDEWSSR